MCTCVYTKAEISNLFLLSFFPFLSHFNLTFQFLSATQSCLVLLCPQLVEKCYNILKQYSLCFVHQPRYFCITHEAKKRHGIKTVCILTVNSQVFFSKGIITTYFRTCNVIYIYCLSQIGWQNDETGAEPDLKKLNLTCTKIDTIQKIN